MRFNPGVMTWQELVGYKQGVIQGYQKLYGLKTFIETGTAHGDMVDFARQIFDDVYSIELHPDRYAGCVARFNSDPNVHLFHGDSEVILPKILSGLLKERILFWLDAHASVETGNMPAQHKFSGLYELESVLKFPLVQSVVLVDDLSEEPFRYVDETSGGYAELTRIAPQAECEMSIARVIIP